MLKHVSVVRSTTYLGSMDFKTAFDEARPRHVAKIVEGYNAHGWIAALLREIADLDGNDVFECVESKFAFDRCLRQGGVEAHCDRRWPTSSWQMLKGCGQGKEWELF